jgi:hypothetical protein
MEPALELDGSNLFDFNLFAKVQYFTFALPREARKRIGHPCVKWSFMRAWASLSGTGLPDFSMCMIPKPETMHEMNPKWS